MKLDQNEILNCGIKKIIHDYPAVGTLLNEYDIGCVTCSVGTCALKDIVSIHNLEPSIETELMAKIIKMIDPTISVSSTVMTKPIQKSTPKIFHYSPPVQSLVDEHKVIKRLLAIIPTFCENLSLPKDQKQIEEIVYFIKNFADKFHHAKEEDILFKYFEGNPEILHVMYEDHKSGRNFVAGILAALDKTDVKEIKTNLLNYRSLLTEHIKKEDEILYPMMDRIFSDKTVGHLFQEFNKVDQSFTEIRNRCCAFVNDLEQKI